MPAIWFVVVVMYLILYILQLVVQPAVLSLASIFTLKSLEASTKVVVAVFFLKRTLRLERMFWFAALMALPALSLFVTLNSLTELESTTPYVRPVPAARQPETSGAPWVMVIAIRAPVPMIVPADLISR